MKTHLIFDIGAIGWIWADDKKERDRSIYILAHEAAHVQVTAELDQAFPGTLCQTVTDDYLDQIGNRIRLVCWEEYAACRMSANFGEDAALFQSELLHEQLSEVWPAVNRAIRQFRYSGDTGTLLEVVGSRVSNLLKSASYVLGSLDGTARTVADLPELAAELNDHRFQDFITELHPLLRQLWDSRGAWDSWDAFQPIADLNIEAWAAAGLNVERDGKGVRVYVPRRPWNS